MQGDDRIDAVPLRNGTVAARLNRMLRDRARPIPDDLLFRSTIVFAPHPDDETLGCGGTIGRLTAAGVPVRVVVMTDGRGSHARLMPGDELAALRRSEVLAATSALGLGGDDVDLLDVEEPRFRDSLERVGERVAAILRAHRPEQLLIPYRHDPHVDHRATSEVVLRVVGDLDDPPTIWEYPIWLWDHWPWTRAWQPTARGRLWWALHGPARAYHLSRHFRHRLDVRAFLELKRNALRQHVSQTTRLRPSARWMTLGDVAQGRWLARFFTGDEFFARHPLRSPAGHAALRSGRASSAS